jgi:hypothetical protein
MRFAQKQRAKGRRRRRRGVEKATLSSDAIFIYPAGAFNKIIGYNGTSFKIRASSAVLVCHFFLASNDLTGDSPT